MRWILIILLAVGLTLEGMAAYALVIAVPERNYGDPDEIQSCRVHDRVVGQREVDRKSTDVNSEVIEAVSCPNASEGMNTKHFSISFSGREFFLER